MKKIKLLMLGLLSVLTLGLFVVTGTKVNAKTYEEGQLFGYEAKDIQSTAITSGTNGSNFEHPTLDYFGIQTSKGFIAGSYTSAISDSTGFFSQDPWCIIPSSSTREMYLKTNGQTKISATMYFANIAKGSSTPFAAGTSTKRKMVFSSGYSNLKFDGSSSASAIDLNNNKITFPAESKIHTITLDYTADITLTLDQDVAFIGVYGEVATASGYNINYV